MAYSFITDFKAWRAGFASLYSAEDTHLTAKTPRKTVARINNEDKAVTTITVNHANYHGRLLKDQTLTFSTTSTTKVLYPNGATVITDGDRGVLKFKAPLHRKGDTTLVTTLTTNAKALHVIDKAQS